MISQRKSASIILGAGFSFVAGLPLARNLLNSRVFVFSNGFEHRRHKVLQLWEKWANDYPERGAEEFLTELYLNRLSSQVPWSWAVELVGATLASPIYEDTPAVRNARYAGRITIPVPVPSHHAFWNTVLSLFDIRGVVTTNYDILAERGLRHRPIISSGRPGFFYGGIPFPQQLKGLAQPFSVMKPERIVELSDGIPVFKLHGSLNWSYEDGDFVMYQDLRPAFRHGGTSLIVPPVLRKSLHLGFKQFGRVPKRF